MFFINFRLQWKFYNRLVFLNFRFKFLYIFICVLKLTLYISEQKKYQIHIFYRQLCAKHKNSNLGDDGASRHQPDPTNQDHRRSAAEHVRLRSGSRDSFFYIYIQYFQEEAAPSRFYIPYKKNSVIQQ